MAHLSNKTEINYRSIFIGIALFLGIILFVDLVPGKPEITITAAIAVLMATWWVTEAIPIGMTSLFPLILFPVFGVLDGKAISNAYINYVIFLFIGGFFMALALEKVGLHKRIALKILTYLGTGLNQILFGFMFASAFLSMWMSNTATAMMMLPIVASVTASLEESYGKNKLGKFGVALLIGVAYGCSIGGIATLVGTPPNLSFVRIFEIIYPNGPEISFGNWMLFSLPITVIMLGIAFLTLKLMYAPKGKIELADPNLFKRKLDELGTPSIEEKRVFSLFITLIFLWVFRTPISLGFFEIPGWSSLFNEPKYINDGTVAIFIAMLLFVIPSSQKNEGLINWTILPKIPWGIVLLFGGGFALAKGFIDSGLSNYIGDQLKETASLPPFTLVLSVTSIMTFLTEFTSNTATTEMLLPVIAGLSNSIQVNPLFLMIPITIAASFAFMFPVATPPNAVVFGSGKLKMLDMVKAGFITNIIGIIVVSVTCYFWGQIVFEIDFNQLPEWVNELNLKH